MKLSKLLSARVALLASALLLTCATAKLSQKLVYVKFSGPAETKFFLPGGQTQCYSPPVPCTGWYRFAFHEDTKEPFYALVGKGRFTIQKYDSMWQLFENGKRLNEGETLTKDDMEGCKTWSPKWRAPRNREPKMQNDAPYPVKTNGEYTFVFARGATEQEAILCDRVGQALMPLMPFTTALVDKRNRLTNEDSKFIRQLLLGMLSEQGVYLQKSESRSAAGKAAPPARQRTQPERPRPAPKRSATEVQPPVSAANRKRQGSRGRNRGKPGRLPRGKRHDFDY